MNVSVRNAGFTLIEMLVAIALLGILGVISWRGLDYVSGQRERIDRDTEETARMLRVLSQIERDLAQTAPDSLLPTTATPGPLPMAIVVMPTDIDTAALEILRRVGTDTDATRIQRVVYRIADGALVRGTSLAASTWPAGNIVNTLPLLQGARRLAVRIYSGGLWFDPTSATTTQNQARARGIEITIDTADSKRYVRVFVL